MSRAEDWVDIGDLMASGYCDDCDMDPALCYECGKCIYDMAMDDLLEE